MIRCASTFILCVVASMVLADEGPSIEIIDIPAYGSLGQLSGVVTGVEAPTAYVVATYIQPEGAGWWTKPYAAAGQRTVPVGPDGCFTVDVTTGGAASADPQAVLYSVKLMVAGAEPPLAAGSAWLPESPLFLAEDTRERYGRTLRFAGFTWGVKQSPIPVGPGENLFSFGVDNVWVDQSGRLHLTVREQASQWYATEVVLTESLGYGRYLFQTSGAMQQLDPSIVFGAFLWDAFGEPGLPGGRCNREVDFEDAVWPDGPPGNTQFVVQPWDTPGNLYRFTRPGDLPPDGRMTRILTWSPSHLHFVMLRGLHTFSYPAGDVIEEWTYRHDPAADHYVPDAKRERFRFNLYLHAGETPGGGARERAIVDQFAWSPLLGGDANSDGAVDLDDFVILKANFGLATGATWADGDFNNDGVVDLDDFAILKQNFGM